METGLLQLPSELHIFIASYTNGADQYNLMRVCKILHEVLKANDLRRPTTLYVGYGSSDVVIDGFLANNLRRLGLRTLILEHRHLTCMNARKVHSVTAEWSVDALQKVLSDCPNITAITIPICSHVHWQKMTWPEPLCNGEKHPYLPSNSKVRCIILDAYCDRGYVNSKGHSSYKVAERLLLQLQGRHPEHRPSALSKVVISRVRLTPLRPKYDDLPMFASFPNKQTLKIAGTNTLGIADVGRIVRQDSHIYEQHCDITLRIVT